LQFLRQITIYDWRLARLPGQPSPGIDIAAFGTLAQLIQVAFPDQAARQPSPAGFAPQAGKHPQNP